MNEYDSEVEDLLGGGIPLEEKPVKRFTRKRRTLKKQEDLDFFVTRSGVTTYWLAQAFGMSAESVRRRLTDVRPCGGSGGKGYKYLLKDAAPYLVDPKTDLTEYFQNMKAKDLPAILQKEVWDAKLKQQKWEQAALDLWRTSDVMDVLAATFATIKASIQLWPDTVERQIGLTDEQRNLLVHLGDELQDEIHKNIVSMSRERSTKSSVDDLDEELKAK